jgi:hypothetical protein
VSSSFLFLFSTPDFLMFWLHMFIWNMCHSEIFMVRRILEKEYLKLKYYLPSLKKAGLVGESCMGKHGSA